MASNRTCQGAIQIKCSFKILHFHDGRWRSFEVKQVFCIVQTCESVSVFKNEASILDGSFTGGNIFAKPAKPDRSAARLRHCSSILHALKRPLGPLGSTRCLSILRNSALTDHSATRSRKNLAWTQNVSRWILRGEGPAVGPGRLKMVSIKQVATHQTSRRKHGHNIERNSYPRHRHRHTSIQVGATGLSNPTSKN